MGGVSLFLAWANIFLLSTLYSSQNFTNEHMRLCKKKKVLIPRVPLFPFTN